jgi:Ras-related protein Rab-1A
MIEEENSEDKDQGIKLSLKILLIGDTQVGKTSLLLNYTDHIFPEEHIATIGVEYKDKFIIKDNYNIRLQIWDTAGQERFHSITKNIYRNANGVLFVYDITNQESFNNIKNWIKDLQNVGKDIKGVIIGNKIDLEKNRIITKEDLEEIAKKYEMPFLETSVKNNININEAFELIIDELLKNKDVNQIVEQYSRKTRSDLSISTKRTERKNKKGGCC